MAEGKKSFTAYCDWEETFNSLPDDKAGQLVKHLFAYVNDRNPETEDMLIKAVFAQMKATLKRDLKKWEQKKEQNRENARKRWDKNNAVVCGRIQMDAKNAVSDSVSERVSDSVTDKDILINVDELKEKYLSNDKLTNAVIENKENKFKNLEHLKSQIEKFNKHLNEDGVFSKEWSDYTSHFRNWNKKNANNSTGKKPTDITL